MVMVFVLISDGVVTEEWIVMIAQMRLLVVSIIVWS